MSLAAPDSSSSVMGLRPHEDGAGTGGTPMERRGKDKEQEVRREKRAAQTV